MVEKNSFCEQCGSPLMGGETFCTSCGVPMSQKAPPEIIEDRSAEDRLTERTGSAVTAKLTEKGGVIEFIIPDVEWQSGFLGMNLEYLNIPATADCLIFAFQSEEMIEMTEQYYERVQNSFKVGGKNWRTFISSYDFSDAPWNYYRTMSREDILAENARNFTIPYNEIKSANLEMVEDRESPYDALHLTLEGKKYQLELLLSNGREVLDFLESRIKVTVEQDG
jgi:uncharacterized Zn finger protein (UPF0148 family)